MMRQTRVLREAVIDTGPLMNVLALNYAHRKGLSFPARQRLLSGEIAGRYLTDQPDNQERLLKLFGRFTRMLVTGNVVGELQGLRTALKLDEDRMQEFWEMSAEYFRQHGLEEVPVPLTNLAADNRFSRLLGRLGPTDVGLLSLARQSRRPLLCDDERTLFPASFVVDVDCELVSNLVAVRS